MKITYTIMISSKHFAPEFMFDSGTVCEISREEESQVVLVCSIIHPASKIPEKMKGAFLPGNSTVEFKEYNIPKLNEVEQF